MQWWQKPRVFKRYGLWHMIAPGVPARRFWTWEAAMEYALRWWTR